MARIVSDQITTDLARKCVDDLTSTLKRTLQLATTNTQQAMIMVDAAEAVLILAAAAVKLSIEGHLHNGDPPMPTRAETLAMALIIMRGMNAGGTFTELQLAAQRDISLLLANGFPLVKGSACECPNCKSH